MPAKFAMALLTVVSCALIAACTTTSRHELHEPVASARNDCDEAYLAWITAEYPLWEGTPTPPRYEVEALEPVFDACTVAELAEASDRYRRLATESGPGPHEIRWIAEMGDNPVEVANDRGEDCDQLAGTTLCVDIATLKGDRDAK